MITIKKIAGIAGVSRGTVDRVINKRGGVSPDVEKRIAGVIKQYNYRPNKVARALVNSRKLFTIGVVSATVENVFFRDVLQGIRRAASEIKDIGVSLRYWEVVRFSVADQLAYIDNLLAEGIDALAINPINDAKIKKKLAALAKSGMPIITFNSDIKGIGRLAYIGCDYRKSGKIAAGLVAMASREQGNVAIVTGSLKSLGHCLRVKGFREELSRFASLRVTEVVEMFDDDDTSYAKVRDLLERNGGIDAFFFSAAGKRGGIRAIREHGFGEPPKIVTVDIDPFTRHCLAGGIVSATVCQQPFLQGYEPVRQLAEYLVHGDLPKQKIQYTQAEILIQQSV